MLVHLDIEHNSFSLFIYTLASATHHAFLHLLVLDNQLVLEKIHHCIDVQWCIEY